MVALYCCPSSTCLLVITDNLCFEGMLVNRCAGLEQRLQGSPVPGLMWRVLVQQEGQ